MPKTENESPYFKTKTSLQDLIDYDLKVLFVSGEPTVAILKAGHHFANETNQFWQCLSESGLVHTQLKYYDEKKLPSRYRIGIVTLYSNENTMTLTEIVNNRAKLTKMVQKYCPRVICFVGKDVFESYSSLDCTEFGIQSMIIPWAHKKGEASVFVMPSTNRRALLPNKAVETTYFDELNSLVQIQYEKYPKPDASTTDFE